MTFRGSGMVAFKPESRAVRGGAWVVSCESWLQGIVLSGNIRVLPRNWIASCPLFATLSRLAITSAHPHVSLQIVVPPR